MNDTLTLVLAILMAFTAVGILCYEAGCDSANRRKRQQVADQYEAALAPSRQRHPAGRDAA